MHRNFRKNTDLIDRRAIASREKILRNERFFFNGKVFFNSHVSLPVSTKRSRFSFPVAKILR